MSVGPIEVVRAQEATQLRHVDSQKAQHAQEQLSRNFHETIQHEQYKPNQAANSENREYRYDAKEKGNSQYNGNRGNKKGKEDKKDTNKQKGTPGSGKIDILI